jgi:hypothetical protein
MNTILRAAAVAVAASLASLVGMAHAESRYASTLGATEIPINAGTRLEFSCQQSATGVCYNTLIAESGAVTEKLAVVMGQKRYLYDVPDSMQLCVTDAPMRQLSDCRSLQRVGDLLAPTRRQ